MSILARNDQFLTWALGTRCWIADLAGDNVAASAHADRALAISDGTSDPVRALAVAFAARVRLDAGDPARARDELLTAAGGPELPAFERPFWPHVCELLVRAELELGDLQAAERWAEVAEAGVGESPIAGRKVEALRARGAVALRAGDPESAAAVFDAAAAAADGGELPLEAACARVLAADALREMGETEAAATRLTAAVEAFRRCGAPSRADRAARDLRALGRRVPRSGARGGDGGGIDALSARERQVAELVAAGATNRAIAEQLYLSEKTVETHLSRIFRKLGVTSRAQVAAAVAAAAAA
jgi:DNA-binding NarL/FixJ family response regulator